MTVREGSVEAPTRHPLDWKSADFWDQQRSTKKWSACSTSATDADAA
jgi:hypothetical protein